MMGNKMYIELVPGFWGECEEIKEHNNTRIIHFNSWVDTQSLTHHIKLRDIKYNNPTDHTVVIYNS